jgi:hypothetical protein
VFCITCFVVLCCCRDSRRAFSTDLKLQLWHAAAAPPLCGLCQQTIHTIGDAEVDHVVPWSHGGSTDLANAQLVHRYVRLISLFSRHCTLEVVALFGAVNTWCCICSVVVYLYYVAAAMMQRAAMKTLMCCRAAIGGAAAAATAQKVCLLMHQRLCDSNICDSMLLYNRRFCNRHKGNRTAAATSGAASSTSYSSIAPAVAADISRQQ